MKEKLIEEYEKERHLYSEFAALVEGIIKVFLRSENFKFQISNRAKDIEKMSEKIDRKAQIGKKYKSLAEIEDLAGVRVVFYLESEKKQFLKKFFKRV